MVSLRCKMIVTEELGRLGLSYLAIDRGVVEVSEISNLQREQFKINLLHFGLEVLDDKRSILIEKIKTAITEMIHYSDENRKVNYSYDISEKLKYGYFEN